MGLKQHVRIVAMPTKLPQKSLAHAREHVIRRDEVRAVIDAVLAVPRLVQTTGADGTVVVHSCHKAVGQRIVHPRHGVNVGVSPPTLPSRDQTRFATIFRGW